MPVTDLRFTLTELLSLIGVAQAVYVLVYMAFRAGGIKTAMLPFVYFLFLAVAFLLDFAERFLGGGIENYDLLQWFFWFSGPPLSVLLILQIARSGQLPTAREYWVLALPPLAFAAALGLAMRQEGCAFPHACPALRDLLVITGLLAGLTSMIAVWINRRPVREVAGQKGGQERYWLILTLIVVNLFFLGFMLLRGPEADSHEKTMLIRTVTGIALVYLAGTSLFRIYPQTVQIKAARAVALNAEERTVAEKIKALIDMEKIYHEPNCSRSDLARELNVPEGMVSKVINSTYGCTFPQLINERRVEDAKRLLIETDAAVKVVADEVGFNSLASFNRVFRDITGQTPTDYRAAGKAA